MKKIFLIPAVFILCSLSIFSQKYVKDEAGILDADSIQILEAKCEQLTQQFDCGIYLATVNDFQSYRGLISSFNVNPDQNTQETSYTSYTIENFSYDYFMSNNFGAGEQKNGLLLILSMQDRDFDIMAYGDFGNMAFTDFGKEALEEAFINDFSANKWFGGFSKYLKKVHYELKWAAKGKPYDYRSLATRVETIPKAFVVALIASLIISLILTKAKKSGLNNIAAAKTAKNYFISDKINFTLKQDNFIRISETRTHVSSSSSSGGSGSHGGTTVHSNGSSHHSGKF